MLTLLRRLSARPARPGPLAGLDVTVYTRADCCCCDKAIGVLEAARRTRGFRISRVDVDSDPGLAEAHGSTVPVVAIAGKVRFRGVVNPVLLARLLDAETAARGV